MGKKQLIQTGLLLIIVPMGVALVMTVYSMMGTFNAISQEKPINPDQMADGIMRSLVYTWIALPLAIIGLACIVTALFRSGQK